MDESVYDNLDDEFDELQRLQNETLDSTDRTNDTSQDDVDRRSVYVGNVEYSATPQNLQEYFKSCGQINRITIMVDKWTGHPKGYAYIEFAQEESVENALLLNETLFKERLIKVTSKRKNIPGMSRSKPPGRGRGRGFFRPHYKSR